MSPDGREGGFEPAVSLLPAAHAILLHGGRALVLFEGAEAAPPRRGELLHAGGTLTWTAECWRAGAGWSGLAVLDALPDAGAELRGLNEARRWRFACAPRVDIAPQPLANLVRKGGVDQRAVFDFLVRQLIEGQPTDCAEAQAHQAFARGFFTAAAERDGFIEILTEPECGGLFLQGRSLSVPTGRATLASVAGDLAVHEVEVAQFARDDILPPGLGFCLFGKAWRLERAGDLDAVFFEKEGRLLRLDVVASAVTRFAGEDTLSGTTAPIAVGLDAVLEAPDGGLLLLGWMLDPLHRLRRAIVKGGASGYAQIQETWVRLPRPDHCADFASDPRFTGLLDPEDALYGFIAHVPPRARIEGAQTYLELVLDDESCLFRPLSLTPFPSAERLRQVLAALSPSEPELGRIVEEHLTPFLASVPARAAAPQAGARPIPLGEPGPVREVAAIMPARGLAELQPVFALLAGTPEAQALDLVLVTSRAAAAEVLKPLAEAFRFYGLRGALVISSERDTLAGRLDPGVAASTGARILAWSPSVLPKAPGWLAQLIAEADALPAPGLISPAMTYEDGSIYFSGSEAPAPAGLVCAVAGYAADWLNFGAPVALSAGAAEIALINRALLARAGGFAGHLFSDAYARLDLADRLRRADAGVWCSGSVAFWMLEDGQAAEAGTFVRLMEQVDAGLLARRGQRKAGDPIR